MGYLLADISKDIKLPEAAIYIIMNTASKRYKIYNIPKRNGRGMRTIAQPSKEVKMIQYWIISHILSLFPIHESATGYRKGKNIYYNAMLHRNNKFILKMDMKDFFPSITPMSFQKILMNSSSETIKNYINEEDINLLLNCLFWKNNLTRKKQLSIGAPSSPILSNIVMYNIDVKIKKICSKYNAVYTRYADDITISCSQPGILKSIEKQITKIINKCKSPHLTINDIKTVHLSTKRSRRVTGLIISNDRNVSLGWKRKKEIKSMIYKYTKDYDLEQKTYLRGYLSFIKDVEPTFYEYLKIKYGEDIINQIVS